jgi:hypothetical protein
MKKINLLILLVVIGFTSFGQIKSHVMNKETTTVACKLTTPELQERKRTVIAEIKQIVVERTETEKGIQYKFDGSDKTIDLLTSFIKTERLCCNFFTFKLIIGEEENFVWLELVGPKGTKEFIETEIGF